MIPDVFLNALRDWWGPNPAPGVPEEEPDLPRERAITPRDTRGYECCRPSSPGAATVYCDGRMIREKDLLRCTKCGREAQPEPDEADE